MPCRRLLCAVAALGVLAVAGCGGDGDQGDGPVRPAAASPGDLEQIETVVADVEDALDAGDRERACEGLGPQAREQVADVAHGEAANCAAGLRRLFPAGGKGRKEMEEGGESAVEGIAVRSALVTIRVDGRPIRVPFVVEGGRWKVDSFYGLAPQPSKAFK